MWQPGKVNSCSQVFYVIPHVFGGVYETDQLQRLHPIANRMFGLWRLPTRFSFISAASFRRS